MSENNPVSVYVKSRKLSLVPIYQALALNGDSHMGGENTHLES